MNFKQLDVYWIDLDPARGVETQKKRPCVIIQSDLVNQNSRSLIVAPILRGHKPWPFVVNVKKSSKNGLDEHRHINLKQMRSVDVSRVDKKLGTIEKKYLSNIGDAINIIFDL